MRTSNAIANKVLSILISISIVLLYMTAPVVLCYSGELPDHENKAAEVSDRMPAAEYEKHSIAANNLVESKNDIENMMSTGYAEPLKPQPMSDPSTWVWLYNYDEPSPAITENAEPSVTDVANSCAPEAEQAQPITPDNGQYSNNTIVDVPAYYGDPILQESTPQPADQPCDPSQPVIQDQAGTPDNSANNSSPQPSEDSAPVAPATTEESYSGPVESISQPDAGPDISASEPVQLNDNASQPADNTVPDYNTSLQTQTAPDNNTEPVYQDPTNEANTGSNVTGQTDDRSQEYVPDKLPDTNITDWATDNSASQPDQPEAPAYPADPAPSIDNGSPQQDNNGDILQGDQQDGQSELEQEPEPVQDQPSNNIDVPVVTDAPVAQDAAIDTTAQQDSQPEPAQPDNGYQQAQDTVGVTTPDQGGQTAEPEPPQEQPVVEETPPPDMLNAPDPSEVNIAIDNDNSYYAESTDGFSVSIDEGILAVEFPDGTGYKYDINNDSPISQNDGNGGMFYPTNDGVGYWDGNSNNWDYNPTTTEWENINADGIPDPGPIQPPFVDPSNPQIPYEDTTPPPDTGLC